LTSLIPAYVDLIPFVHADLIPFVHADLMVAMKQDPDAELSSSSSSDDSSSDDDGDSDDDSHGGRSKRQGRRGKRLGTSGSHSSLSSDDYIRGGEGEDLVRRGSGGGKMSDWKEKADPEAGTQLARLTLDLDNLFKVRAEPVMTFPNEKVSTFKSEYKRLSNYQQGPALSRLA
jgi:hypothetical protein